ncbi:LOW QUALITY PROTEIN: hypothetical protein N665_1584s0004 [Sinapis alba]|nr:LOW QUALITY PROTEIN: hypothetical protein N665_1584s0004 [Sinapis alba]
MTTMSKAQRTKPTPGSQRLVLLCVHVFTFLLVVFSVISTVNLGFGVSTNSIFLPRDISSRQHTLSDKYLYWGNRVEFPGKNCETCEGLGNQESSLRCALEEAMFHNRTFVMPSGMCINPTHNKEGILNQSDNKTTEEGWVGSSSAMDSLYEIIDLISDKVPVILDDSKTCHVKEERGTAHAYGVSHQWLTVSHYSKLFIFNLTASPLSCYMQSPLTPLRLILGEGSLSAKIEAIVAPVMLPCSFLPTMAAEKLRNAAKKKLTIFSTAITRYVFQSTVHTIWKEINRQRHGEASSPAALLVKKIDKNLKNKIIIIHKKGDKTLEEGMRFLFDTR